MDSEFIERPLVTEKIGESTMKVFFDPSIYSIAYSAVRTAGEEIKEKTAGNVHVIDDRGRFSEGVIILEANLARVFDFGLLEEAADEIKNLILKHKR